MDVAQSPAVLPLAPAQQAQLVRNVRSSITNLNQMPLVFELGAHTCSMLYWGYLGESWWRNYMHVHSFFEVCYAFAGSGVFHINGRDHAIRPGDLFIARPSEQHEIISSEDNPLGICFWAYTLTTEHQLHKPAAEDSLEIDALLARHLASTWAVAHDCTTILPLLDLLAHEAANAAPGFRVIVRGLAAKLILDTLRVNSEHSPIRPQLSTGLRPTSNTSAQRITQYLIDNFSQPITIRDVAAQVHLSERHTSRLFHAVMGISIMDHLLLIRINAASQLLISNALPIRRIGELCGFPDVQHFTTVFRRQTGLTPGAFRKRGGTQFIDASGPQPAT
jgi:AraC-like DNA-binding protein/mannose-6-phosphate isomerase-like protein (cupin superfamily)